MVFRRGRAAHPVHYFKETLCGDGHTCEAKANDHKFCKHTVAHRLLQCYVERLGASEVTGATKPVRNWQAGTGHTVVETKRASLLTEAGNATLVKRTVKDEMYESIDV